MKILCNKFDRQGNTLILTLVITGVLGFLLVAYLSLVRSQNISNMRSQSWNQTIPVIEAGIEDALTHLNSHGMTNLNTDNWSQLGNIYYMKRWVGDNYYVVTISNWVPNVTNNVPVIESRGFVTMPVIMAAAPGPFLADISLDDARFLGRGVRVNTKQDWLFAKGLVAKGQIDLNGNNIQTDSFDSTDANYSSNGLYTVNKRKDHGDIATNSGLTNSINIGNADIWGRVSTGPGGSVSIGPQGAVGDIAWHNAHMRGIKPGWTNDDMNVDFPDVDPPFSGGGFALSSGTNNGIYYKYLLNSSGNYEKASLSMSSSDTLYVKSNVNAVVYITGDVSMSGNAQIKVEKGATLKLYVAGASASLNGNGVINLTGNATNFAYYGLPSNTSLSFGGNATFIGVIYAPNANLELNGGGSGDTDFVGASVSSTVKMNGHFKFHYDEDLAKHGPFRRYIVTRWDEMTPQEVSASIIDTSPEGVIH